VLKRIKVGTVRTSGWGGAGGVASARMCGREEAGGVASARMCGREGAGGVASARMCGREGGVACTYESERAMKRTNPFRKLIWMMQSMRVHMQLLHVVAVQSE